MKYAIQMILVIALLSSLGCSTQPITNHITIPPVPTFPVLTEVQEDSLSDEVREVINDRESLFSAYIRNLKARIEANNRRSK